MFLFLYVGLGGSHGQFRHLGEDKSFSLLSQTMTENFVGKMFLCEQRFYNFPAVVGVGRRDPWSG